MTTVAGGPALNRDYHPRPMSRRLERHAGRSGLRVLVVGQGAPATGGIPTFVTTLVRSPLLRDVAQISLLNTTPRGNRQPGSITAANLSRSATDVVRVFRAARRADVVHLNVSAAPAAPLLRALVLCATARAAGTRTILHAHTGRLHLASRGRAYRWLLRASRSVVDAFVVVSRIEAEAARRVGLAPLTISNGVDASRFRTGPKDSPPMIAFVGTVCERKGLLDLRDALARIRQDDALSFRLEIVGDGAQEGPDAFEQIRDAYAEAELPDVVFHGALDREDVDEVLARASIFCLPSHWEGLPLSLLEAMAAETAPVATRVGEIPWMLDEGRAGFVVEPRDVATLASALDELLRDPSRRAELAAAARRRVEEHYADRTCFEAIAALYRRLSDYSM